MTVFNQKLRNLLRHGDRVEVFPMDGRKRTLDLKRTVYQIDHLVGAEERIVGQTIKLRSLSSSSSFELSLAPINGRDFFKVRAKGEMPFFHNGCLSMESFVHHGDNIDIGFNRFIFKKEADLDMPKDLPIKIWPKEMFVSLEGETGTGKTTLARNLHDHFCGPQNPFIAINLSSFSEGLIESEIFGHEKGAFTGALNEKRGAVELAKGGTLFIDELDSLPRYLQIKILTFLDDKKFRRVGGERERQADCRLIFSSGQKLATLVTRGDFRMDLFYRVSSGLSVKLPSLRDQRGLIRNYLLRFEQEKGLTLSKELTDFLISYSWPGNFRQLTSHLERRAFLCMGKGLLHLSESEADLEHLAEIGFDYTNEVISLEEMKKSYCKRILMRNRGSIESASLQLGIAKSTLRRMMAA